MSGICRRGFTMIEMLIVLMTVGLLAAVALPSLSRAIAPHTSSRRLSARPQVQFSILN